MCVIALCVEESSRLTAEIVAQMYSANPAGAGIAWRERRDDANVVLWEKGLDLADIIELALEVPLPYVTHFRIPTCGGPLKSLCHPFLVSEDAPLDLNGETSRYVLVHNGHWSNWEDKICAIAERTGQKLPAGEWSDTRAMAWATSVMGPGYLDFRIKEKAVLFGPERFHIISPHANAWTRTTENIYVSNTSWRSVRQWVQTTGQSGQTNSESSSKEGHTALQTSTKNGNDSAQNLACSQDDRLPAIYRTPAAQVEANLRSPFNKSGRLITRITPDMMAGWEVMHKTTNKQGHPQLSRKKIKRYRAAYELQQKEDARIEMAEKLSQIGQLTATTSILH